MPGWPSVPHKPPPPSAENESVKDDERLQRLARLTVEVGANVQAGQTVVVTGHTEHAPLAREIARAAYRAGANRVYPDYIDRHFDRALIELGPQESLALSSAGDVALLEDLVARKGAVIRIHGEPAPDLLMDLDQTRVGMLMPIDYLRRWRDAVGGRKVNWTIVSLPNPAWALQVFGEPDVERLWNAVEKVVRLDTVDPVAAWKAHMQRLGKIATVLNERHFDALHYRGPGTNLTVGLLPGSKWCVSTSRPPSAYDIFRTCPRKRCSRAPTGGGLRAGCDRPGRSRLVARW
jgi:aminopeptidase